MTRDPRYDVLFEPVQIGPVTARNRFYQVPHCSGMGYRYPRSDAAHRGVKAQGGWAIVSTQEVEIHPSADVSPANEGRLWDEGDLPALWRMVEAVHAHGSLAAIQLVHGGLNGINRYSRLPALGPSAGALTSDDPAQGRPMDLADIRAFRRWHREAALRAKRAGFDVITVYAGHELSVLHQFLLPRYNHRTDEYGGPLVNRVRLLREVIEETKDAVGDRCAVSVRIAVEELLGPDEGMTHDGEAAEVIGLLAEVPDMWDVNLSDWSNDSQTSRFAEEAYQEPYTRFVKRLTTKPVVGVGRLTSPDTMVRLIRQGVLDLIGGARPSIADPFLPAKIERGDIDDIRECIGCNICVSGDNTNVPMRCTQNPTVGEEWRRGWHPEHLPPLPGGHRVLVVGGGPAGLEAARALVQRGAEVTLADSAAHWGGRVTQESGLPGLSAWVRVRDWRLGQIKRSAHAHLYLASPMDAESVMDLGLPVVLLATGSRWRLDGVGRAHRRPLPWMADAPVWSPDAIMAAELPAAGPVVVFDDDRYYLASLLAEACVAAGLETLFITPAPVVQPWSEMTLEQGRIQARLMERGVTLITGHRLAGWHGGQLNLACMLTGRPQTVPCATLIPVTTRSPRDSLYRDLMARQQDWAAHGLARVTLIGDAHTPGTIAAAVHAGHLAARAVGEAAPEDSDAVPFLREDRSAAL